MSEPLNALAVDYSVEDSGIEPPILVLEKQLTDTLELTWRIHQARIRSNCSTSMKTQLLFEGMASELQSFSEMIRQRLASLQNHQGDACEIQSAPYWRLFSADPADLHELLDSLVSGYARYARQTSEAIASLQRQGDLESLELLAIIFKSADRCLWFLEIYLEGSAFKTNSSRLPDWPAISADCIGGL